MDSKDKLVTLEDLKVVHDGVEALETRMTSAEDDISDTVKKSAGGTFNGDVAVDIADGTTSTQGWSSVLIGNNKATGTAGNSGGDLQIFGRTSYKTEFISPPNSPTANRVIYIPDKSGTMMLSSGGTFDGLVSIDQADGTTSTQGWSQLRLGNDKSTGTAGNSAGFIRFYGTNQYKVDLYVKEGALTAHRNVFLPDASGTIALTSDIDSVQTTSLALDSGYTANSNRIRKIGSKIVEIHLYVASATNITKGSWVRIGVVPSGYRPESSVYNMCIDNTNGLPLETRVTSSGDLSVWAPASNPDFTLFAADFMYTV